MSNADSRSIELKAAIVAAIGSISVGFVPFFAVGLQRAGFDTVSLLLWRYIIALAILIPMALVFHRLADEWRRGGRWLMLNGLLVGTFQVFCYFKAIETLLTSVVITIFYCYPILTLALDRLLYRMPISGITMIAVSTIIIGVGLTSLPGFAGATLDPRGVTFAAMSAVAYAIYVATAYPFTRNVAPVASAVFIYGSFAIAFGTATLFTGFATPPRPELWLNLLFIGTLGGALQILSFSYALPRLASSGYAVIVCLEVVTVVLAGVVLLGESLVPVQWLGIALVLGGIVVARARRRKIPATLPSTAAALSATPTEAEGHEPVAVQNSDAFPTSPSTASTAPAPRA